MSKIFALLVALLLFAAVDARAEDQNTGLPQIEALDTPTLEKLSKEGEASLQHDILARMAGTWSFDLKFTAKKDAAPQTSSGTAVNEMILGGRFLSGKMTTILNIGGQNLAYEGVSLIGYDKTKKAYTTVLADTLRSGVTAGSGQYDEKLKTLTLKGRFAFPLAEKERAYRAEITVVSSDAYRQTVFAADAAGKEYKVLEIEFRKQ